MRLILALLLAISSAGWADVPSKSEVKAARKAFQRALELQKHNRAAEAFQEFTEAANLDSANLEYVTAKEMSRQQLVHEHLQRGNEALLATDRVLALAEFRAAAELDPANQFALERLRQALADPSTPPSANVKLLEQAEEIELRPNPGRQNFHYTGDTRGLMELVTRNFGLTATFDESFKPRAVKFNIDDLDFAGAISLASRFAGAMWSPLSEKQILIAQDTPENHRLFERMSLRTFYLPDIGTPQEMNEIVAVLRGLFDIRHIVPNAAQSIITVRAPKATLDVATAWLEALGGGRPQLMLDVRAYEVNDSLLRVLGLNLPLQFQVFNIPASALQIAQNPNIQDLINQLIASGGLNQANTQAISALLAQLQSQQQNPLLTQRFATFGGGLTLFGVGIPPLILNASLDKSRVSSIEHMTLRAAEGSAATFRVGSRFPVLNGTFAPLVNTPAINDLLTNQTFVAAFPSFTFEDLGITLKATPQVHGTPWQPRTAARDAGEVHSDTEVTLALELEIRSLSSVSLNGIPVISNRTYTGAVRLREGEPAVVAGMISRSEQRSMSGLPGLGQLAALGRVAVNENKNASDDEILFVITPYVVRSAEQSGATELWLPPGQ
jgi:type II secretory pathway component GspD/PulD (secretin)